MKRPLQLLLFAGCLLVAGCRPEDHQAEILTRLKALEAEAAKRPGPVRWAYVDKSKIAGAFYARATEQVEEFLRAEKVSAEQMAKVAEYEALNREWQSKRMRMSMVLPTRIEPSTRPPLPPTELTAGSPAAPPVPRPPTRLPLPSFYGQSGSPAEEAELEALAKRVAEAKAPVAGIVDRRAQIMAQAFKSQLVEELVAEYAKGRFDLVMDKEEKVLYRTAGEVPDITQGVLKLFRERAKP